MLAQAVQHFGEFGLHQLEGRFSVSLGEAYLLQGQLERAQERISFGLDATRAARYGFGVGGAQRALGRLARAQGALPEAERFLRDALDAYLSVEAAFEAAHTRLELADVAHARGDLATAAEQLASARRAFVVLGIPRYLTRTATMAAQLGVA